MAEEESSGSSAIVGPQYCSPQSVQLKVTKKRSSLTDGNFIITDINDNLIFKVKAAFFTLHRRRTLLDASGNPVLTLHKKIMTMHDRWEIFKGESAKADDLLFSVRRSSIFQWKWKFSMDVFLANKGASVRDFKVEVRWFKKTCAVYAGDSSNSVAKMEKKNGSFIVTLEPNIDSALIASIILVLDYYFDANSTTKAVKGVVENTVDIIGSSDIFWT